MPFRGISPLVAAGVALLGACAGRLVTFTWPATTDEGGFLAVGAQWHHGSSLYGNYWVDRPPLLIAIFRVAAASGGLPALRTIGILATTVAVLAAARTVQSVFGDRAALVTAFSTAALLGNPLSGARAVNGELLAAPFIALSVLGTVVALSSERQRWWPAAAGGACAAAAVLVKQNMIDGLVFALVAWLLVRRRESTHWRRFPPLFVGGGLTATAALLGVAWMLGTTPAQVWFASYTFRARSSALVLSQDHDRVLAAAHDLAVTLALHGVLVMSAIILCALVARRGHSPRARAVLTAVTLTLAYDLVAMLLGGFFWEHYAVQPIVPAAIGVGAASTRLPRLAIVAPVVAVVACVAATASTLFNPGPQGSVARVARDIAAASRPGDSALMYARPDAIWASGLPSPYPYIWRLPARTLDPGNRRLLALLNGSERPTWVVIWIRPDRLGSGAAQIRHALAAHYQITDRRGRFPVYRRMDRPRHLP